MPWHQHGTPWHPRQAQPTRPDTFPRAPSSLQPTYRARIGLEAAFFVYKQANHHTPDYANRPRRKSLPNPQRKSGPGTNKPQGPHTWTATINRIDTLFPGTLIPHSSAVPDTEHLSQVSR